MKNHEPLPTVSSRDTVLSEFNERLNEIANEPARLPILDTPHEPHEFEMMTNKALDAMVATFEQAVAEAQSQLNEAKALADKVRADIKNRARELNQHNDAARAFAERTFNTCKNYLGEFVATPENTSRAS
jgi:molecular chaperone GrpE (heat shock protein)